MHMCTIHILIKILTMILHYTSTNSVLFATVNQKKPIQFRKLGTCEKHDLRVPTSY